MKKSFKHGLAAVLSFALCFSMLNLTVLAADDQSTENGPHKPETIPTLEPQWGEECTIEDGVHYKVCTACNGDADGHKVECDTKVIVENLPDCVNKGNSHTICLECERTISNSSLNALGHAPVAFGEVVTADCDHQGTTAGTKCERCGHVFTEPGTSPITEHPGWSDWQPHNATQHMKVCTAYNTHVQYADHSFGDWTEVDATNHKHTCPDCGYEVSAAHAYDKPNPIRWSISANTDEYGWYVNPSDPTQMIRTGTKQCDDCSHTEPVNEVKSRGNAVLTISYLYANGESAHEQYWKEVTVGTTYSVTSPSITGYTADKATVTGAVNSNEDITVIVTYTANEYTLTVEYNGLPEDLAIESKTSQVAYGADIGVGEIPVVTGYTGVARDTNATTMPAAAVTVYVDYTRNSYTLTINYVDEQGNERAGTHTEPVAYEAGYSVKSPVVDGYTADQNTVSGTMPARDVKVTVTYTANPVTPNPNPNPNPDPNPDPNPGPVVNPEPPVEIEEPDVPLVDEPTPAEDPVEIDEPDVPLAEDPDVEIDEPDVPLADVPKTGDVSLIWEAVALASGTGLAGLAFGKKKRKDSEEE